MNEQRGDEKSIDEDELGLSYPLISLEEGNQGHSFLNLPLSWTFVLCEPYRAPIRPTIVHPVSHMCGTFKVRWISASKVHGVIRPLRCRPSQKDHEGCPFYAGIGEVSAWISTSACVVSEVGQCFRESVLVLAWISTSDSVDQY